MCWLARESASPCRARRKALPPKVRSASAPTPGRCVRCSAGWWRCRCDARFLVMLLALDVGNSEVTAGLFLGAELLVRWRLTTIVDRTPDEWAVALESFVLRAGHAPAEITGCCVASVVPGVTQALIPALHLVFGGRIGVVDSQAGLPLYLDVDEPLAVGADRIALALGALALY